MKKAIYLILLCAVPALMGCTAGGAADWQELREQANELYNEQKYQEALDVYEKALSRAQGNDRLTLRQDLIDCHQALGNQAKARELLKTQLEEAHAASNIQMEAEALFALGMQIYDTGDKPTAYDYMTQAVELVEKHSASDGPYLLAYYHYVLMKRRADDQDHRQALSDGVAVEACLKQSDEPEKGEAMLVRSLALRAYLYLELDSTAKADSTYGVWQQHQPIAVSSEREICPYLMQRGRYDEVTRIQQRYVEWVREKKGLWTAAERTSTYQMAEAEAALGHGDEAFRLMKQANEINDTLQARQAEANAQELEAIYQNQLKTEQISRLRLWVIILGGVLAVVTVAMLTVRLRRLRRAKNRAIISIAKSMTITDPTPDPSPTREGSSCAQADASRFMAFDRTIEQGRLYTQPDLTRGMLAELMGVDRTTFSRIIQEQSGCKNMNDYLNQKRIRHAAQLLREQPNYTVQAVMEDSGFQSKSNFIRLFRETYGMTPSEYRNGGQ